MNTIPSTSTLYSNILSNLQTQLGITNPIVKKTFLIPLAAMWAGVMTVWYKTLAQVQANIWVDTCDDTTLLRFGYIILARYPYQAIQGQYSCFITGTSGTVIPAGTVWKADDTSASPGQLYTNDSPYTIPSLSTPVIVLRALTGGTIAQLAIGDTLTVTAPIVGLNNTATVHIETVTPIDGELLSDYRTKVIEKIQLIPGSWSAVDYRLLGVEVAGVRQIYAYTDLTTGNTVDVYVEGTTYGAIPSASSTVVTNVQTAIAPDVPLGVHTVNYASSNTNIIAVNVVVTPYPALSSAQQSLITTALVDFINTVRPFIASADTIASRNDIISAYNLFPVISSVIPGVPFSGVTFTVDTVAATTYQADLGNIPYCNSVTFS